MPSVIVLGSANVDQILRVERIPAPGETVLATSSATARGGKGQNQAVAASRSGAETTLIAAVGDDAFGADTRAGLVSDGVGVDLLRTVDAPTGIALITVDPSGENTIVVDPGANRLLAHLSEADAAAIASADVLAMQLEVPLPTVTAAARIARSAGTTVILNAAPIADLPPELLGLLDILVVNEHEASHLAEGADWHVLVAAVPEVVVTLGARGAVVLRRGEPDSEVAAPSVVAVDATGAGDTFCGVLATGVAEGMSRAEAVALAVTAASLSVQRQGAVPSIPLRAEIDAVRASAGN